MSQMVHEGELLWAQTGEPRANVQTALGGRSMILDTWYRHLAIANRLIVEARDHVDCQKAQVSERERDGQDASRAAVLLELLEETLHLMHSHRATILRRVAGHEVQTATPSNSGTVVIADNLVRLREVEFDPCLGAASPRLPPCGQRNCTREPLEWGE
jgi:hypothetical protein